MKNFSSGGSSTISGSIIEGTKFTKCRDFVGTYDKDALKIKGYLNSHSSNFNKDSYSLYIERTKPVKGMDEASMLMNVPEWYGRKLEEDFRSSGQSADEYFDTSLKEVVKFKTNNYNTDSYDIVVY